MRNAILIDPNYFENIKNNSVEIEKNLTLIKGIKDSHRSDILIYWIDDNINSLKKSYIELIKNTLDPQFKNLIEYYYQKINCEQIDSDLSIFKINNNFTLNDYELFNKKHPYIKLFYTKFKKVNNLKYDIDYNLKSFNIVTLKKLFSDLFQNVASITFSDPFILKHVLFLKNIYNEKLNKFNPIQSSNKKNYIFTLQFLLDAIFESNKNFKDIEINILTSYYSDPTSKHMNNYMENYIKNNNGQICKVHDEIKEKLKNSLVSKESGIDLKIKIVDSHNDDKKDRFYQRTIKLKYKSSARMTIMVHKGIDFLEGKNKLTEYQIGNYEIELASNKQAVTYDNYKRHREFSTENDEMTAKRIQSMSV
jgi:hypothetical protein